MSDIKSKEEVLRKNIGLLPYINSYEKSNSIFQAMDEFAKQQSIEFYEFTQTECWEKYSGIDRWKKVAGKPSPPKTFDELYPLFLAHQLKQQV